jgi:hypothetical protein
VPALVATPIALAFVIVFLDAFHAATPHDLQRAPGEFAVRSLAGGDAARAAVLHRARH